MLSFEMRTVLYGIRLFNDAGQKHRSNIYMKWKKGAESKTAERQKERVCERGRVAARRGSVGRKKGR